MSRTTEPVSWLYVLDFGKYKGECVADVFQRDWTYVRWLWREEILLFKDNVTDVIVETEMEDTEEYYPTSPEDWEF